MAGGLKLALTLPGEEEILSKAEKRFLNFPGLVRKTIRYRNGIVLTLIEDFSESIFSISLDFSVAPIRISQNGTLTGSIETRASKKRPFRRPNGVS